MKELKNFTVDKHQIVLKDNLVRSAIIPNVVAELDRDVSIQGETVVEGALYARNLEITKGPFEVQGAVFTQMECSVYSDVKEPVIFRKCVGSAGAVIAQAKGGRTYFGADVNAKTVNLKNAYVAANIFADDIVLENCIVLGGVFATKNLSLNNVIVGTFNSPHVSLSQEIHLLLPSAFSVEPFACLPGTLIINHSIADLGALMRGVPEKEKTGSIPIDPLKEEQRVVLADEAGNTSVVRCLSVVGKVLAADLLDLNKLQNHFLISAGSLGAQLLKTYDIGNDSAGKPVLLTPETIAEFFFKILDGRIKPRQLSASFTLEELIAVYGE